MGFYYNQPGVNMINANGSSARKQQQGFYYNQEQPGFYYNQQQQQPGFYYDQQQQQLGFYYNQQQQGFYYDQQDGDTNFAAEWKTNEVSAKVMTAAKKIASAKVAAVLIANQHAPGATENRILAQISAERLAYEAAEIYMNATAPNAKLTIKEIRSALFAIAVKAIDGK